MKNIWISLVFVLLFIGCSSGQEPIKSYPAKPKIGIIAIDVHGYQYRLVSLEKKISDGIFLSEIWEKIKPLETNHWYTPTLSSKEDTNAPLMFNSLGR